MGYVKNYGFIGTLPELIKELDSKFTANNIDYLQSLIMSKSQDLLVNTSKNFTYPVQTGTLQNSHKLVVSGQKNRFMKTGYIVDTVPYAAQVWDGNKTGVTHWYDYTQNYMSNTWQNLTLSIIDNFFDTDSKKYVNSQGIIPRNREWQGLYFEAKLQAFYYSLNKSRKNDGKRKLNMRRVYKSFNLVRDRPGS